MAETIPHISVCICTYKRPHLLKRSLQGLRSQASEGLFNYSVVVADNDRAESGKQVVADFASSSAIETTYCVEPEQNIALARNKALEHAKGDYVAWIDDDEFPTDGWLLNLLKACEKYHADGVLGPVKPCFETQPPKWVIRGRFCERAVYETGLVLDWRQTTTANAFIRRNILRGVAEPFQRAFGSGGEDCNFFRHMMGNGRIFVWCNEALVHEVMPPERCKRSYHFKRALIQGQNQRHFINLPSIAKSIVAVPLYIMLLPFLVFSGQCVLMKYVLKLLHHVGKLAAISGFRPFGDKYLSG